MPSPTRSKGLFRLLRGRNTNQGACPFRLEAPRRCPFCTPRKFIRPQARPFPAHVPHQFPPSVLFQSIAHILFDIFRNVARNGGSALVNWHRFCPPEMILRQFFAQKSPNPLQPLGHTAVITLRDPAKIKPRPYVGPPSEYRPGRGNGYCRICGARKPR